MIKSIMEIDKKNHIFDYKIAKENLNNGQELEPELKPEFINDLLNAKKEKTIKVGDFSKHSYRKSYKH